MLKSVMVLLMCTIVVSISTDVYAQGPKGRDIGFGLVIGEPLGLTAKFWTTSENAWQVSVGASYFGSPRLQVDYLWHVNAFNSSVVKLIVGPGAGFGFGRQGSAYWYHEKGNKYWYYRENDAFGLGARVITGINVIPRNAPVEFFFEVGPNIGIYPGFGVGLDAAIGLRFYP